MKTKMIYIIGVCFVFFSLTSCTDEESHTQKIEEIDENGVVKMSADNMEIKYKMQSSPELILADRLIYRDDTYQLDLSWEEASQLGVSRDVYQEFVRNVEEINSNPDNY